MSCVVNPQDSSIFVPLPPGSWSEECPKEGDRPRVGGLAAFEGDIECAEKNSSLGAIFPVISMVWRVEDCSLRYCWSSHRSCVIMPALPGSSHGCMSGPSTLCRTSRVTLVEAFFSLLPCSFPCGVLTFQTLFVGKALDGLRVLFGLALAESWRVNLNVF